MVLGVVMKMKVKDCLEQQEKVEFSFHYFLVDKNEDISPNKLIVILSVGQEKIVRAFTEIMKNMARMKTCIRPAMCKPYGKQSESLQKS